MNALKVKYNIFMLGLKPLATSYEKQIKLYPDFVLLTNELALDFDDGYQVAHQLKESELISEKVFDLLSQIDRILEEISDRLRGDVWNDKALKENRVWEECRILARKA